MFKFSNKVVCSKTSGLIMIEIQIDIRSLDWERNNISVRLYSLQRQKTSGMKAPTATKIGNIAVVSSLS